MKSAHALGLALMFCIGLAASPAGAGDLTGGIAAPHVNIAIFHKLHGRESFAFPKTIRGTDIITALSGKAQFVALNHTAGLKDADVIAIGNDVLREGADDFEDYGVDCQMTVHVQGKAVTLSGMCEFLMLDRDHRQIEHKGIIHPATIRPGSGWFLVHDNAEDGIAVYASVTFGKE